MSDKMKGNLLLLLTAIFWGSGFISQKLGNEAMPPMTFNALRQLMAGIVLAPIVAGNMAKSGYLSVDSNTEEEIRLKKKRVMIGGVLCGILLLLGTATQQIGLLTVSAGKSGFITSLYIVIVPFISVLFGEKVGKKSVFCVAVAMIGFAIMSLKGGLGGATIGDWLTLISATSFAAQIVVVSLYVDEGNALKLAQMQFLSCGIIGLVIALITEQPALAAVVAGAGPLIYQTLVPTAGGYTLQMVGQKYAESTTAALLMSTEAIFAAIFGSLILREAMSARELIGAAIIFAAIILGQIEPKEKPTGNKSSQ